MKSRFEITRRVLIFWTLFIGYGAVLGAAGMLADPSGAALGMDEMLPYFTVLPFSNILFDNLTFSGFALLAVNGLPNIIAAILLIAKKKSGTVLGGILGITLMLWICIQFCIFPLNFMSTAFFIFGICQAICGYAAWVFIQQESFSVNIRDYTNIGTNKKELTVYFSRMGYVKKKAYEAADESGSDIYEIKPTERISGTLGFWWCGRFGMHRWDMPIEEIDIDLTAYDKVTVCSPVWVFSLASPVRAFCRKSAGKIKQADYILVHHTNGKYENVADEMDSLLGIKHTGLKSIQCKMGRYKNAPAKSEGLNAQQIE